MAVAALVRIQHGPPEICEGNQMSAQEEKAQKTVIQVSADLNLNQYLFTEDRGETVNIVDGLLAIAGAIDCLARAIDRLGTADAATPMGAIEILSMEIKEGFSSVASAIAEGHEH
jgi:hypothetical protein